MVCVVKWSTELLLIKTAGMFWLSGLLRASGNSCIRDLDGSLLVFKIGNRSAYFDGRNLSFCFFC